MAIDRLGLRVAATGINILNRGRGRAHARSFVPLWSSEIKEGAFICGLRN